MDELLALFVVIAIINALNKAAKKRTKKTVSSSAFGQTAQTQPLQQTVSKSASAPMAEGESRTAVDPDVHAAKRPEYMGSMLVDSDEGEDACDPTLAHDRPERVDPHSVYAGEIGAEHRLDFSPEGLWQGVVMSEILTRPAERQRRKGASWRN